MSRHLFTCLLLYILVGLEAKCFHVSPKSRIRGVLSCWLSIDMFEYFSGREILFYLRGSSRYELNYKIFTNCTWIFLYFMVLERSSLTVYIVFVELLNQSLVLSDLYQFADVEIVTFFHAHELSEYR